MAFLLDAAHGSTVPERNFHVTPVGKIVRCADYKAVVDARELIEGARVDAAQILEQARAAYNAERERGHADGMHAAQAEQAAAMMRISQQTANYLGNIERDIVDLVVASVRRIVTDFDASERVLAVVRGGLAMLRQQKQVLLRVHTDDAMLVREHMQTLLSQFPGVDYLDVVADDRFERGACRIETLIGTIETSLDSQLDVLQRALEHTVCPVAQEKGDRGQERENV